MRITPAVLFFVAAVLGFPVTAAFVALAAPLLVGGFLRVPPVLTANHMMTLGWGTMVALGALNQLLPAAAGVRRENGRSAIVQFVLYLPGVLALAAGFWTQSSVLLIGGASAVVAAVLVHLATALTILLKRTRWLPTLDYITCALLSLAGVTIWGLLFVLNWRFAFWPFLLRAEGLLVHLILGLIGWFGLLTTGVSYYLLPRFAGRDTGTRPRRVLLVLAAGVLVAITGAFTGRSLRSAGLLLLASGGMFYALDLRSLLLAWRPRGRDITHVHWLIILIQTVVLSMGLAAGALGLLPGDGRRWTAAGITMFLLGWLTLAISGQAYKVSPFLLWHYRFGKGMAALDVPRLEAPYWPREAVPVVVLLASAGPLIAAGILTGAPWVATVGAAAFFAGACVFAYLMGYSWLLKPRKRTSP